MSSCPSTAGDLAVTLPEQTPCPFPITGAFEWEAFEVEPS
jgi:hypothetical protein